MILQGIGPFSQLLTMDGIPVSGSIADSELEIITDGAIVYSDGKIVAAGSYRTIRNKFPNVEFTKINTPSVCIPGLIDVHTHICWGGSRSADYASRVSGKSYLEIAREGGGINVSVKETREASQSELSRSLREL